MKLFKMLTPLLLLIGVLGCKEEIMGPQSGDGTAPDPISNPQVNAIPGGAKITYTLPKSENLLYVKAEYELADGKKYEARASYFNNNVTVEGFADTREREITLYSVSRGEVASSPVKVKITPGTPPVEMIFNSLDVQPTFGGPSIKYTNSHGAKVVIELLLDSSGIWTERDAEYTQQLIGEFNARGLPAVERKFGIFVRDRWNNRSDTMSITLTPLPEELLEDPTYRGDKKWKIPQVPPLPESGQPMKDAVDYSGSYKAPNLFDDNTGSMYHTKQYVDQPVWIVFELKKKTKLSRFIFWQRLGGYIWDHGNPHRWQLWGSNDYNDVNSWVLMGDYLMTKPSGGDSPGVGGPADTEAANKGHEFNFLPGAPAVKYLAWKNIDSWGNIGGQTGFFHISELQLYGNPE